MTQRHTGKADHPYAQDMYGTKHLSRAFDTLYSEKNASRLERAVMVASTVGFLLHLLVIAIVRNSDHPPELFEAAGSSYFNAIYTPFSFILFYEVLMLVRALPRSLILASFNYISYVHRTKHRLDPDHDDAPQTE